MTQNDEFDVRIEDVGSYIRVYGPNKVSRTTEIPLLSKDGGDTGIKYAVGPDVTTGETKVAWIDYPKTVFTYDDIVNNPRIKQIFRRCNVCVAVDRIKNESTLSESRPSTGFPTYQPSHATYSGTPRLSLGDVAIPKYIPLAMQLLRSLLLTKFGEVTTSIALSVLTDVLSGATSDPVKRDILRSVSDAFASDTLYSLTPEDVEQLKKDLSTLASAYQTDRNLLTAVVKASIKPPSSVLDTGKKTSGSKTLAGVRAFRGVLD